MTSRLPIRWRLTLWYATFLALALMVFGGAIYFAVRHEIYNSFEEELHNRAAVALAALRSDASGLAIDSTAVASLRDDEHFVRLISVEGRTIVDTSPDVGVGSASPALIADVRAGHEHLYKLAGAEGRFWIISTPIHAHGNVVGLLEVGSSSEDEDDLLRILGAALIVAAPVAFVLACLGGYMLAGRALKPVTNITKLADRITSDELHARLNLDLPNDELGQLACTFDAMLARIEDAFERQRRFTGDAAHELRTPLTLIRSQVDVALARSRTADEYRDALVAIDDDVDRLTTLVTTLLTLARSDSGKLPLERTAFRLEDVIRATTHQYTPSAESKSIELVNETTPATVEGDEDLMLQVLSNLLDNAIAHTNAGGRIVVGNHAEDRQIRIWVEDNGTGIPDEHIERVFDRFYRVDQGRTRREGGTGLGLAISKAIVEAHGGSMQLTSSPGRGTRVEISLPKVPADTSQPQLKFIPISSKAGSFESRG